MNQLWQAWFDGLTTDKLDSITKECEAYTVFNATIGDTIHNTEDTDFRRSELRWVDPYKSKWIKDLIWHYAEEANRNAFGFDINYLREIQYTTYKASNLGKYDWHQDTFWANPRAFDRKISVVIQMSDPSDYEGGDFEFDPDVPPPDPQLLRKRGMVMVFPSFLRHRVTPVTKGVRKSLVAWIEGPKFR